MTFEKQMGMLELCCLHNQKILYYDGFEVVKKNELMRNSRFETGIKIF